MGPFIELKCFCLQGNNFLNSEFCVSEVLKLGNAGRINERCLELQKHKKDDVSKMKVVITGTCATRG